MLIVGPKHGAHLYYTNHDFTTQMLFLLHDYPITHFHYMICIVTTLFVILLHALCNNRPVSSASEFQTSAAAATSVNNIVNTAQIVKTCRYFYVACSKWNIWYW